MTDSKVDPYEQQRRLLQEYIFSLEEARDQAEELSRAHEALKRSQELLSTVMSLTVHGLCFLKDRTFLWVNQAFTDILGWENEELLGKTTALLYDSAAEYERVGGEVYPELSEVGLKTYEYDLRHKDGHRVPCLVSGRPLDKQHPEKGFVFSVTDISALKQSQRNLQQAYQELQRRAVELQQLNQELEQEINKRQQAEEQLHNYRNHLEELVAARTAELTQANERLRQEMEERLRVEKDKAELASQLLQAQKMEAIGTLAGGLAHDFNNILQVIQGYVDFIRLDKVKAAMVASELREIEKAAQRGSDLIQQLLTFSRKGERRLTVIDLNQEIRHVKEILTRTIPRMIDIQLELEPHLKKIKADPIQLEQLLINLGVNARDAMPEGGRLAIATTNVTLDEDYCRRHFGLRPGDYVLLSVRDTGCGMPREMLGHIFEPFFTTKAVGQGSGLGLAMVYGIVQNHQGYITCDSDPGHGTTFHIYLPVFEGEPETLEEKERDKDLKGWGTETILVVDDEDILRSITARMLTRFGYTVLTAASGEEALRIYQEHSGGIDLVLLDMIMPGMGGKKCLREIMQANPAAKVIIASGYENSETLQDTLAAGAKEILYKPYNFKKMLHSIRQVLDDEAAPRLSKTS